MLKCKLNLKLALIIQRPILSTYTFDILTETQTDVLLSKTKW